MEHKRDRDTGYGDVDPSDGFDRCAQPDDRSGEEGAAGQTELVELIDAGHHHAIAMSFTNGVEFVVDEGFPCTAGQRIVHRPEHGTGDQRGERR